MTDRYAALREATAAAVLGAGKTPAELRQAVLAGKPPARLMALVDKIRARASTITDEDIDMLRKDFSEDELFEIIIAAAFGAARERLAAAQRALEGV